MLHGCRIIRSTAIMIYYWANEFLNVGVLTYPEERRPRPGASDSEDNQ